jgi:general secretion pathway protein H
MPRSATGPSTDVKKGTLPFSQVYQGCRAVSAIAGKRVASPFSRGFTLLEILVVVLIIGVVLGIATLAIRDNPEQRLETEGQRFAALLRLAAQEAVLQSREVAVVFERNGYHFLVLEEGEWIQPEDKVFHPRALPDGMEFDLVIEGERLEFGSQRRRDPRIFVLSGGEMTPFELGIRFGDRSAVYRIRGDIGGRLALGV